MTSAIERATIEPRPIERVRGLTILAAAVGLGWSQAEALALRPSERYRALWLLIAFCASVVCVWKLFLERGRSERLRLTLDGTGLEVGGTLYRWSDIRGFGLQEDFRTVFTFFRDNKRIYWCFGESGLASLDSVDYDLPASELAELLNAHLSRATGRTRALWAGPRFPGQLLRPTVFYIRNYVFLLSVGLWLVFRFLPFYR